MEQPTIFDLVSIYRNIKEQKPDLYDKVHFALETIMQSFSKYGISSTAVSYNGGKDSDVCAHLWRMALFLYLENQGRLGEYQETLESSLFIVFHSPFDFEEINNHLQDTITNIGVQVIHSNKSFKEGLDIIISSFQVKAILLGVRRTDPYASDLQPHTHSTPDFPPFMRILPILNWTFGDVWDFIFTFSIPYCSLYREGYEIESRLTTGTLRLGQHKIPGRILLFCWRTEATHMLLPLKIGHLSVAVEISWLVLFVLFLFWVVSLSFSGNEYER